jgi:Ran GTPase-activating protein (RanGAP) involved in mRNA processing and transport
MEPDSAVSGFLDLNMAAFERNLEFDDIHALAQASRFNKYFTGLVVKDLDIGKENLVALCEALKYNDMISKIVLSNCAATKETWLVLSDAFSVPLDNRSIRHLDLSGNGTMDDKVCSSTTLFEHNFAS